MKAGRAPRAPGKPERPPPPPARRLIVTADDLGMSPGINRGIAHGIRHGIVTGASLMVLRPAAAEAGAWARSNPALGVGLHLDLGEWSWNGEEWVARYVVVPTDSRVGVARELDRQLVIFERMVGRTPSHIDSHQHVHMQPPVLDIVLERGRRLGLPVRGHSGIRCCGDFYGRTGRGELYRAGIGIPALEAILEALTPGVTELVCHPGFDDDQVDYGPERRTEVETLCAPHIRRLIRARSIELLSFQQVTLAR